MAINANVSGGQQITASVGETKIDVSVSGGVGPTGAQGAPGATDYTQLTNVPASFPPSAHGHTIADVSGLSVALDGKQAAGSYAASVHTHTAAQITDFAAAVVAAAPPTTNASLLTSGTLDAARLPGSVVLTTDARLSDARQPLTHTHTASQISDFTAAVIAAAPPTVDASLLTQGILPDSRLSSSIARTSDVSSAVAAVVNAAPATLDTLAELASALGSDANFSTTVTNSLAAKAPINNPTFTGTVSGVTKAMVGLGNVDNTSDASKPVSTATQTALNGKANTSHAHGNITTDGAIGSTSGRIVMTGASGVLEANAWPSIAVTNVIATGGVSGTWQGNAIDVSFGGTGATTAAGARANLGLVIGTNVAAASHTQAWSTITATPTTLSGYGITDAVSSSDARLTDARTPLAHNQAWSTITSTPTTLAGYGITDAAGVSHTHSASQVTEGTFDVARIPSLPASQIGSGSLALARLPVVLEQTQAVGNSGTSTTLALTTGSVQTVTLSGNCTFTMPSATAGASITLILTQSGTFTASFTGVLWAGGTAPTITATANKVDILVFVSDGTNWYGTASQNH